MSLTCRIFSFKSSRKWQETFLPVRLYDIYKWHFWTLIYKVEIPAPSSDRVKSVCASIFCVCLSDARLSIFRPCLWRCRMEEEIGGRVSYSGKQRLKQLSKHCQLCSWALERDLLVLLCVLSEVTQWRLWFLSWTPVLAPHHPRWCPTGGKTVSNLNFKNKWLVWENKCSFIFNFSSCCYGLCAQTWFVSAIASCWLDKHMIA